MIVAFTLAEIYRFSYGIVFLVFLFVVIWWMVRNTKTLTHILEQAQLDRDARDRHLIDLKAKAELLERKAEEAAMVGSKHLADLHAEIATNTEMTIKAANASAKAEESANTTNEKIAANTELISETNERLLEHVASAKKSQGADAIKADVKVAVGAIEDIKTTVDDTNTRVKKVEQMTTPGKPAEGTS